MSVFSQTVSAPDNDAAQLDTDTAKVKAKETNASVMYSTFVFQHVQTDVSFRIGFGFCPDVNDPTKCGILVPPATDTVPVQTFVLGGVGNVGCLREDIYVVNDGADDADCNITLL